MLPIGLLFAGYKLLEKAFEWSDRDAASVDVIEARTAAAPPAQRAATRQYWIDHRSEIVDQLKAQEARQKTVEFQKVLLFWGCLLVAFIASCYIYPGWFLRTLFEGLPSNPPLPYNEYR